MGVHFVLIAKSSTTHLLIFDMLKHDIIKERHSQVAHQLCNNLPQTFCLYTVDKHKNIGSWMFLYSFTVIYQLREPNQHKHVCNWVRLVKWWRTSCDTNTSFPLGCGLTCLLSVSQVELINLKVNCSYFSLSEGALLFKPNPGTRMLHETRPWYWWRSIPLVDWALDAYIRVQLVP